MVRHVPPPREGMPQFRGHVGATTTGVLVAENAVVVVRSMRPRGDVVVDAVVETESAVGTSAAVLTVMVVDAASVVMGIGCCDELEMVVSVDPSWSSDGVGDAVGSLVVGAVQPPRRQSEIRTESA